MTKEKSLSDKVVITIIIITITIVTIGGVIAALTPMKDRPGNKTEIEKEPKIYNTSIGNTMLDAGEYGTIFYEKINSYTYNPSEKSITITYYSDLTESTHRLELLPKMTTMFLLKYKTWRGEIK